MKHGAAITSVSCVESCSPTTSAIEKPSSILREGESDRGALEVILDFGRQINGGVSNVRIGVHC